jgi:hypothetical protein
MVLASLAGVALLACPMGVKADGALSFAVYPATQKVFPDTIPKGEKRAALAGARGEFLSFQVAFRLERGSAALVVSSDAPGATLFEAVYIETAGVAEWGYPASFAEHRRPVYPDPLKKVDEIRLRAGETKAIWVRLPANESGRWTLRAGEAAVPIEVTVWPFELPANRSLSSAVGLGGTGFARCYGVPFASDAYWEMYSKYYDKLLEYRLCAYRVPFGELDDRARRFLMDERVTSFILSYRGDPAQMELYRRNIEGTGAWEKGFFYNIDEPSTKEEYEVAAGQVEFLRKIGDGKMRYALPFYRGLDDRSTPFDHLAGTVNLWVIQTDYYHHGHGLGDKVRRQARERREAGDEIWVYTSLAPRGGWCNLLLNHTGLEHRILFWQLYADPAVSGFLYWHSTYWDRVDDPWTDQATVKHLDPGVWGDGSLFYPGPEGPVPSIRLELIRAGLQDYELLKMAEAAFGREDVMKEVEKVTRSFVRYTSDPVVLEAARLRLGRRLAGVERE